ncbi:hypothetical protein [Neisseria iguanae]|uniref:NERD domain-containing protein n=1 Tax=Neisseria iguanae TaxID=90242 RepID=A0A2P7U183_9NEIS|nr:hypothetical protein [Neisseria iguanae]PSJ80691.1 hypothetical protein C7N83_04715 [Neisseria iguanae]
MKHFFECIENKLSEMDKEKREFVFSLINNPLSAQHAEIKKYIPSQFISNFLLLQKNAIQGAKCKKYFLHKSVFQFGIKSYCLDEYGRENIIYNQVLIENDYRERIKEDLIRNNYMEWGSLSQRSQVSLYAFYALSDLIIYILLQVISVSSEGYYKLVEEYLIPYKMMWFSRYFTQQSHISDSFMQGEILNCDTRDSLKFQNWVNIVIDKNLSIHPDYVKFFNKKDKEVFIKIRKKVEFISYLSFRLTKHIIQNKEKYAKEIYNDSERNSLENTINRSEITSFGFLEEEIDDFFDNMDSLKISKNDRIATVINDECIRINDINLKFSLQTNLSKDLANIEERGIWFENKYILKYLNDVLDKKRFMVTEGINDPKEKYDADIIIYDKKSNLIYFCQIKHRIKTIHPAFRDEFSEYYHNEELKKGVKQLSSLRDKVLTSQVKERLISRMGKKVVANLNLLNGSRFILLHSIENLDMCTKDGVSLYEWNTFRKILRDERSYFKNGGLCYTFRGDQIVDFSDIIKTQEYLAVNMQKEYIALGGKNDPVYRWELLKNSRGLFAFNTAIWLMNKPFFKSKWHLWNVPLIL